MVEASVLKNLWVQIAATFLGTLMAISNGMAYGWSAPMVPYLLSNQTHIPITRAEGERLETMLFIGAAAGLPTTVFVVNYFGRKGSMLLSSAVGCIYWTMILTTDKLWVIYIARFLSGMAGNMCFIGAPMYIAEIADHRIRGFLSASIYIMLLLGILTVYAAGALLPFYAVPTIGIVITSCEVILFPIMPESPYFYIYNNKDEKAMTSLRRLRPKTANIEKELAEIKMAVERQKTEKGRPQDLLLIRSNRYALLIMLLLNSMEHLVGISVIMMNVHVILEEAGTVYMKSSTAAILFAVIMLLGALCGSVIIDKFGRKFLLITSGSLTGISLLITTIYFHLKNTGHDVLFVSWIPIVCVMFYAATFKLGLGIVPIVMTAEIFPTTIKAIGMTIADLFYVLAAIASLEMYSALFDNFGIHAAFYLFTVCSFGTVLLVFLFIPETKGKTLEEIQLMLKGRRKSEVYHLEATNCDNLLVK
ncbi:unnamed protein product [Ceutorhynchus assimilis]|uniref:Major facilitator superfamily (MFS) profile domain-containing protein n=1 Tax=Ceutorhynchus assimilis TaxID=467358 RepID=A0A9N9MT18_9CUCU|nr:unnamed protein product [Ceutorhynchus assimilis]